MRGAATIATVLVLTAVDAGGQVGPPGETPLAAEAPAATVEEVGDDEWSFSASAAVYVVPDDHDYVQPTITADRGSLHLEARYNYEALDTGSLWLGHTFSGGERLTWQLTPMVGGVFGATNGIAAGYEGSLGWLKLELYSESEVLLDTGDSAESFFYSWSELAISPVDWLRLGVAVQRTRVYQTDREVERGPLVGLVHERLDLTTYVFDPDAGTPTIVVAAGFSF